MNTQRIVGIVMIVIGVILFIVGMNSSESVVDQVSETFTGRFTRDTTGTSSAALVWRSSGC